MGAAVLPEGGRSGPADTRRASGPFMRTPFGSTYGHARKMVESRELLPGLTVNRPNRAGAPQLRRSALSPRISSVLSTAGI